MSLTNAEFAKLDHVRNTMVRASDRAKAKPLQLAMEHIENVQPQLQRAIQLIELLVKQRNQSWCFRVPRFFVVKWAQIKYFAAKWLS